MIFRHLLNMRSHPTWVRGLKLEPDGNGFLNLVSHPTWVRGLKQHSVGCTTIGVSRTLRGCVD